MEKHTTNRLQWLQTSIHEASNYQDGHVSIQSFAVHTYDTNDHETWVFSMQVAYPKNQDVIDIACFYEKNNTYYIATNVSIRPILHARKHLVEQEVGQTTYSGFFQEWVWIIYSIEQWDISIIDAVQRALRSKLWLEVEPHNVEVGNPYFPSIGWSGETCIPCFAQVSPPSDTTSYFLYGSNFEAERKIEFLSIDTIINKFFLGEIEDMRLVLLAYDLAYKKWYPISVSGIQIESADMYENPTISADISVLNNIANINTFQSNNNDIANTIELIPEETISSQFLKKYIVDVENIATQWMWETYMAEMIVREWVDTIDLWGYFWKEWKLYIVSKQSLRPSVQARNLQPHYIHAAWNIWDIEWTSASLCHPLPWTKDEISIIAKKRLHDKVGMEVLSSHYVSSYFPSIWNNAEKVHLVLQKIDPSQTQAIASERNLYQPKICAIEVDSILEAYHQWVLRDPRLVLIAYIIKNITQYENIADAPVSSHDIRAFQQAIHQPLQVDMFMKTVAQQKWDVIYDLHVTWKKYSVWYRRLVSYIEQELWWFLWERNWLLSESDKHFFSAMLPIFAVPSEELASKYINYITHDQWHYLQWDIIPYYPETNTRMDKDEYVKYMSWTEANAVFDSDYLYPMQMWLERFESLIWWESVATTFHKLWIYSDDEVRKTIVMIERDWIIPDHILQHPEYNNVRNNIVDRILRFHVMDKIQAELQYDKWVQAPYIARIALQFCNTTNSIAAFNTRMEEYHLLIQNYDEWVNTLKAYVARIIVKHISLPALHIWTAMQMMADNKAQWYAEGIIYCEKVLSTLMHRKTQTEKTRDTITSMIANDSTIKAIRYANYIRTKVDKLYDEYQLFIQETPYITSTQKDHLQTSRIPYFTGFATMPDNLHDLVLAEEDKNLHRIQK